MMLTLLLAGIPVLSPAAMADEAPPGTVLLPQGIDFTQQEIDDNWGPDRSPPSVAPTSVSFDGRDDVLHYGVDSANPSADESDTSFWRTEGIKSERDLGVAIETDLYLDPAWEDRAVRAGIWTVGEDAGGDRANGFGIIEFSTTRGWESPAIVEKDEGWRVWVSGGGWVDLDTDFTYGEWANLRIELNVTDQVYGLYIDGSLEASIAIDLSPPSTNEAVGLSEVFLNSYNYGYEDVDPAFSNDSYDVHWDGLDFQRAFSSVRDALDAATDGDILDIGPGVYDEGSSFWRIDKSVTLRGAGSDQVTIDRSAAESYGLLVDTDDVTLEGFTFIGSQTGPVEYGLKIEFLDNLLLKDVVVKDSGRTGVDLNTVTNVTLDQVSALDNGGAGIALRNAQGIDVIDAQASGNAWGSLALWAVGSEVLSDVHVSGSSFSDGPAGVFAQHSGTFEDIVLVGNNFTDNGVQVTDQTGVDALDLEAILADNDFDRNVVVRTDPSSISVPAIFSSIQDGVDAAADGQLIAAGPGLYEENVVINKQVGVIATNGPEETAIAGETGGGLGTVVFTGDADGALLAGFTVIGYDSPGAGLENAAVYLQGAHSDLKILGNEIRADGEAALLSEWGQPLTDIQVADNVFSGQTFVGDEPAGVGTSQQFTLDNVPRQLVALGHGGNAAGIEFTANLINGTAGGLNGDGDPQGNTLVTMDASDSTISGNEFAGTTMIWSHSLRARGTDVIIEDNDFSSAGLTSANIHLWLGSDTLPAGTTMADVMDTNTFDKGAWSQDVDFVAVGIAGVVGAASDGSTVNVLAGEYDENLNIDKDDLSLLSEVPSGATISQASPAEPLIGINADGATVKGFNLRAFTSTAAFGAVDVAGTNAVLENLHVLEEEGGAWSLWIHDGADDAEVLDSTFQASDRSNRAIRVDAAADVRISGNLFEPIDTEDRIGGPWIRSNLDIEVTNNTILEAWGEGIVISQQGPAEQQDIILEGNTVTLADDTKSLDLAGVKIANEPATINGGSDAAAYLDGLLDSNPGVESIELWGDWFLVEEGHSIQSFIDRANDGATLLVGPGTYEDDLQIEKNITIAALQGGDALVDVDGQTVIVGSVHAQSSGYLVFEGLHVEATPAAPLKGVALATTDVADVDLVNNTFIADGPISKVNPAFFAGLVDLSGASNVVSSGNTVTGTSQGTGGTSGVQIAYAGNGNVSVLIEDTTVQGHNGTAVTLSGKNPDAQLSMVGSVLSGNTDGLVVNQANFSSLELLDNEVSDQTDIGIRMLGATQGETVLRHNKITSNGLSLVVGNEADSVDARYNWWGSEAGPVLNDQANIFLTDYTPWCLDENCTLTEPVEGVSASLPLSQPAVPVEAEKPGLL